MKERPLLLGCGSFSRTLLFDGSSGMPRICFTSALALPAFGNVLREFMYGSTNYSPTSIKKRRRRYFFSFYFHSGNNSVNITNALNPETSIILAKMAIGHRFTLDLQRYVPTLSSNISTPPKSAKQNTHAMLSNQSFANFHHIFECHRDLSCSKRYFWPVSRITWMRKKDQWHGPWRMLLVLLVKKHMNTWVHTQPK